MNIYNDELKKAVDFTKNNQALVESALELTAISIMKVLNDFNTIEDNITRLIIYYYGMSDLSKLDFKVDVLDSGYLSYGQKLKILEVILEKCDYRKKNNVDSKKYLDPLRIIGDLRNDVIHSIYALDPERFNKNSSRMIIYANGRKISKKDLLAIFSDFDKYAHKSTIILSDVAKYLRKEGNKT